MANGSDGDEYTEISHVQLRLKRTQTRSSDEILGSEPEVGKRSRKTVSSKTPNTDFACSSRQEGQLTRKDLGLHKLVFKKDGLADGTALAYYAGGQIRMVGLKRGLGILCFCCKSEVSPSQFEAHAGFASRRQPYQNIYNLDRASLHKLALTLSQFRKKFPDGKRDNLCSICANGDDLLCCDNCPRAIHTDELEFDRIFGELVDLFPLPSLP